MRAVPRKERCRVQRPSVGSRTRWLRSSTTKLRAMWIVNGGDFTTVDGISLNRIAELHPDGFLDSSFNPGEGADGSVFAVAAQPDGKVLLGGAFGNVDGEPRNF